MKQKYKLDCRQTWLHSEGLVLYISTSNWVLRTPNALIYKVLVTNSYYVFLEKKAVFGGNKTVDNRFGANSKNVFFAKFCCKFFGFFSFLPLKMVKIQQVSMNG